MNQAEGYLDEEKRDQREPRKVVLRERLDLRYEPGENRLEFFEPGDPVLSENRFSHGR